ncbi:carbohydrate ABC transporter permease [Paenibacillus sp. J2TS4]|uniref:carbohydrate ABC transporter permease n=1 Tax=Paenibacillus sp. J2TS4 TaxID=2807194 RepID=UPI001B1FE031|nr:carbohydrate ABC transporter permease [Paenibacillus sp. J2TS4]GIP36653.1 putative ABC transporter permease protein YtcP [Paenibacillus sp. J2TS4]
MIGMTKGQKAFSVFNLLFLTLLSLSMLYPFLYVLAGSFSSGQAISQGRVTVFPIDSTLANYTAVLSNPGIWRSFGVTLFITAAGTLVNLLLTALMAYGLSHRELKGRSLILILVLFTMIFQAPMIPSYLLVKSMAMLDTLWSLILPSAISAFNLIIMISFFQNIPQSLLDAAKIDGCGEYRTLWKVVLPLSIPSLCTIGLFYAVAHWNGYFQAVMYITKPKLYPLQLKLRQLIVENQAEQMMQTASLTLQSLEGIKMATIIIASVPILLVYPFIQKHFIKGAMLGSIKG